MEFKTTTENSKLVFIIDDHGEISKMCLNDDEKFNALDTLTNNGFKTTDGADFRAIFKSSSKEKTKSALFEINMLYDQMKKLHNL